MPFDPQYRYAKESVDERVQRHAAFSPTNSDFFDPAVLQNLGYSEPVADEFYREAQRWYNEDLTDARKKNPAAQQSFKDWLEFMASDMAKVDPKSEAGEVLNPIGTAELFREFSRLQDRVQARAEGQEIKEHADKFGMAGSAALGLFSGMQGFAETASGGLSETIAEGANRIVGGEAGAQRYRAGRQFLSELEAGISNPTVRLSRNFGGLLGYVTPAGGLAKAANAGKMALTGGKTALKEGTWRYGLNKSLATALGAAGPEAGIGTRMAASAGNFLATEAGLKVLNEINTIAQASMAGEDWRGELDRLHSSPEMALLQSAAAGATMPFLQKVGDRVARTFMGAPGSQRRLQILGKSIREMDDWGLRVQAVLARGAGGAAEFSGLSLLPNFNDPSGPFGVASEFVHLFGEDSDERTKALENILSHAVNGFLLKNLHGGPVNQPTAKDRAAANAPGVDRLGVAETMAQARRAADEDINSFFPTIDEIAEAQGRKEGDVYRKIGEHVMRNMAEIWWGPETRQVPLETLYKKMTDEQRKSVEDGLNSAVRLVGSTGKGYSVVNGPDNKPKVVSYSREAAQRYGLTNEERRLIRQSLAETLRATTPEQRDEMAANIVAQQSIAEAAAGMGMPVVTQTGSVDRVLNGMGNSVAEAARTREDAMGAKPNEAVLSRQIQLEDLYTQMDRAQFAGDIQRAASLARRAAALEDQIDKLVAAEAAKKAKKGAGSGTKTDATQGPDSGSDETPPAGSGAVPKPPGPTPTGPGESGVVSPSAARTSAEIEYERLFRGGTASGSGEAGKVAARPTGSVAPKPPTPQVSAESESLSVPSTKWISDAPTQDIAAKLKTLQRFAAQLRLQGKADTDAYRGVNASISALAKEKYKRENQPKPEAPKVDTSAAEAGFAKSGKEKSDLLLPTDIEAGERGIVSEGEKAASRLNSIRRYRAKLEAEEAQRKAESDKEQADDIHNKVGKMAEDLLSGPTIITPTEEKAVSAAWALITRVVGQHGSMKDYMEKAPPASREEISKAFSVIRHVWENRQHYKNVPTSDKDTSLPKDKGTAPRFGSKRKQKTIGEVVEQQSRIIERQGKRIQDERKLARQDALTGVSNRRSMDEYRKTKRAKDKHWVIIDVTNQGVGNNTAGMPAMDQVLKDAAARVVETNTKAGGDTGLVFRAGGDEFAVAADPEIAAKIGSEFADIMGERGLISDREVSGGRLVNRLLSGVGATYEDAAAALNRSKGEFEKVSKRQGWLSKTRDPSKGYVPTDASQPTVRTITGKKAHLTLANLPDGYEIVGAVRSGNSAQIILKDKNGATKIITTGKQGVRDPGEGWLQPQTTKNVIVFGPDGKVLFKAKPTVQTEVAPEPEVETGRIESREQAVARLGSFRRPKVAEAAKSDVTDPVRRAYQLAGALAAEPGKTAEAAKVMEDDLYRRITKAQDAGKPKDEIDRLTAAYNAVRRVREAKQYIEELDANIRREEQFKERTATAINPARMLATSDTALSAAQRSSRDLAATLKTKVEEEIEALKAGRKVAELPPELRDRYHQLWQLRKLADSLIESSPFAKSHGRVDVSQERLPQMSMGDLVDVVIGGKEGGRLVSGIILGSGEPSGASLKRGVGSSGQRIREIEGRAKRGVVLTQGERQLLESSNRFPGKWVTIFTKDGSTVRVRVTDIADIGPSDISKANFSYDPEKGKYGVEVTENRFLSWFAPPDEVRTSRTVKGAGDEDQSIERTQLLLDNESDGYYVRSEKGESGIIPGLQAAELEARQTISSLRNRTARPDQLRYQALAVRAPEKKRQSISGSLAAHGEGTASRGEIIRLMTPEQRQDYFATRDTGGKLPRDTTSITVRYFDPGIKLRQYKDLTDAEKQEHDWWLLQAERADAEREAAERAQGAHEENRKALVLLNHDTDGGEWLIQHRTRGEGGILRQGQTLLAERTPEGTIFVRRLSPVEAGAWMRRKGKGQEWDEFKAESKRDHMRLMADNNKMIAQATMETQLRDYMSLLRQQFQEILNGRTEPFKHEGDLHKEVRRWVRDNPTPKQGTKEYSDWLLEAEQFLFQPPHTERDFRIGEGGRFAIEAVHQDIIGSEPEGGPMFKAAERVRQWREPNSGAQISVDDKGNIKYVHDADAATDFYKAAQRTAKDGGTVLGMYGLGMLPGGASTLFHGMIDAAKMGLRGVDWALERYHRLGKTPARGFSAVMDGVTQFTKSVTDTLLFNHIHDLLHHPDFGSRVVGETGKSFMRKMGVLFGENETAPQMRMYMNDMQGDFYEIAVKANRAIRAFSQLPVAEQRKLLDRFEAGDTPPILKEYRDLIDEYGRVLTETGMFTKETTERFKGKYIHYGRWKWMLDDIDKSIALTEEKLTKATDPSSKGRLRKHLEMLKNARSKTTGSKGRFFLGDHPLDFVNREAINDLFRKGFARMRRHRNITEAEQAGLDTSVPWMLLMDGLLVEGRAVAQAKMLKAAMRDKSIVKEIGEAPHDWVPIEGTRYSQDQIFKEAVGKSIEPQALTMLESINPDYNNFRQAWDMVTGLVKMGLTAGNPTNWQTQMLGNVALLTTKVPWFQIPSRLAKAAITLAGIGQGARERLEKYRRWNWTHHTNDATREMAQLLAKGSVLEMEGTALPDNPYLGMSFFETLGEAVKRAGHGRFRSSMRGFTKAGIDVFTSLDAMARVALHEYLTDTMKMDETASRKIVDKYYDIQHLPKGWQFTRRWFNQFGSINAVMARNLGELVPNSPAAITNLSMLAYMWNLAYQGLTGMSDEDKDRIIDASIPNNNGFTNWIGKKTAFLWPKGDGTTRVIDMNKFSPVDTGLRAFPGLAPTVQGLANVAAEGRWAPGMDGKDIAGNFADFAASNLLYGPQVDWFFNRDRFNEGQPIRETMDEPGTFGRTGYLRYMIERGNLPGMFSAALPPGAREFAAATIPSGVKNIRRIGESSDTGFLGTRPRYVTGTDEKGKAVARKYDRLDAALEAMGFQFARADEYARVRELAERSSSDLIKGKFGLSKRRTVEAGSPEAAQTGQAIRDADAMGDMNRALRLVAQIKHYESLPLNDRTTVGEQITKTIGSPDNLRDMISILWQMEEYDLSRDIGAFFEQEHGMNLIPAKATGAERMSKGRFGSLRENK